MTTPNAFEQEMLELINRARMDPGGEFDRLITDAASRTAVQPNITNAIRFFNTDMGLLETQLNALTAAAPLAWNANLEASAETHSQLMIDLDQQSHNLPGEPGLLQRVQNAGYTNLSQVAENLYAFTDDPVFGHAGFFIDWGTGPTGIQTPAGHRNALMNATYQEIGITALEDNNPATSVGPFVVTQHLGARRGYEAQLVGVVIDDTDNDNFYDAGEGLGGITVTATGAAGSANTTTWASGGYQMHLDPGTYTVVFSGGALNTQEVRQTVTIGNVNVKLDARAQDAVAPPSDDRTINGNDSANNLAGGIGNDTINGGAGNDTLNGNEGADFITPGIGSDTVNGGAGLDTISFVDLTRGVQANLETGQAVSGNDTDTMRNIENVTGTIFGDYIVGDDGANRIRSLGDYDWLVGSNGADYYDGGNGRDMISYVFSDTGVTVDLAAGRGRAGQADGDRYVSIERVTGSIHNDLMYGDDGANDFRGLGGYDWFVGSGGGKDRYDGGSGKDTVAYSGSASGVTASLLLGRGSGGDAARDLYTSIENLTGSSHDDVLTGDNGRNVLRGLYGEDRLFGNGGVDRLTGGGNDDYLDGGSGWDYAFFSGNRADYTVANVGNRTTVTHLGGREGTDTLVNIEVAVFADGDLIL